MTVVNQEVLSGLRRYEDAETGLSEEFVDAIGSVGATGILSRPVGRPVRSTGWVICPAVGKKRSYLRRLETLVAHTLTRSGYPVVRIRGGSENVAEEQREMSLVHRLEEIEAAVRMLEGDEGVRRVGLAGAIFGGTMAALTAERLGLDLLALWEPELRGQGFLKDAFRRQVLAALVATPEASTNGAAPPPRRSAGQELAAQGWTMIRGFRLTQEVHDEIAKIDLIKDITTFRGDVLVLAPSTTGEPGRRMAELGAHLEAIGARTTLVGIEDELLVPFGEWYFRDVGLARLDSRLELDRKLSETTTEWMTALDARRNGDGT
jgi:hypothetical protein